MPTEALKLFRQAIEEIADQLCLTVDGNFDLRVNVDSADQSVEKLRMLINFVLDAARRSIASVEQANVDLVRQKREMDAARVEAEAASRAKSEFLASMSHELRTPLTAIIGFSQILQEGLNGGEQLEAAETISRNGAYLLDVINDILDLAKVEAGRIEVSTLECDVHQVLEEVVSLMRVRALAKGLDVGYEFDGDVPRVIRTDPLRLKQILINLVGNGIKFTEKGDVRIVVRQLPAPYDMLEFDVIDQGIGIAKDSVVDLFSPFTQADSSTSRRFGGTGLGLTISRRFSRLLGGDVVVHESRVGVGTTFRLTVRANIHAAERSTRKEAGPPGIAPENDAKIRLDGMRLLVAEDGPDNRKLITHFLTHAGATVELAENGKLACDAVSKATETGESFDAILMDMQMPEMDGYEATRALRLSDCRIPIIALTAHAMAGDREKCVDAGCDGFATKPIDRNQLLRLIREQVDAGVEMATCGENRASH